MNGPVPDWWRTTLWGQRGRTPPLLAAATVAGVVFGLALISLVPLRFGSSSLVLWPVNAPPLVVLLGRRPWNWQQAALVVFACGIGIDAAVLASGGSALRALALACADSMEIAAAIVFAWSPIVPKPLLRRPRNVLKFVVAVAIVGPASGAIAIGLARLAEGDYWSPTAERTWVASHSFGNLVFTIVLLFLFDRARRPILPPGKRLHASIAALAGLAALIILFQQSNPAPVFLTPLVLAGLGMIAGLRLTCLVWATLASVALVVTGLGYGPCAAIDPAGGIAPVVLLQATLYASFAVALPMILAFERRGRVIAQLRRQKAGILSRATRFRGLAEIAADTILVTSPDGIIRYASPAAERLIGLPGTALTGRSVLDLIHPDDRQAVCSVMAKLGGEVREVTAELRLRHPETAEPVWTEVKTRVGNSLPGQQIELVSVVRDISARRIVQERRDADLTRLDRLANADPLTNLANRRRFNDHLETEWRRALRENGDIALVLIDVDHFKSYNDRYGHPAGDLVLRQIATVAERGAMRPTDLAARIGGEEFAVILPATFLSGARAVAERIREGIRELQIVHEAGLSGILSVSIGIDCVRPDTANSWNVLIERADQALYRAKIKRGSIVVAS